MNKRIDTSLIFYPKISDLSKKYQIKKYFFNTLTIWPVDFTQQHTPRSTYEQIQQFQYKLKKDDKVFCCLIHFDLNGYYEELMGFATVAKIMELQTGNYQLVYYEKEDECWFIDMGDYAQHRLIRYDIETSFFLTHQITLTYNVSNWLYYNLPYDEQEIIGQLSGYPSPGLYFKVPKLNKYDLRQFLKSSVYETYNDAIYPQPFINGNYVIFQLTNNQYHKLLKYKYPIHLIDIPDQMWIQIFKGTNNVSYCPDRHDVYVKYFTQKFIDEQLSF